MAIAITLEEYFSNNKIDYELIKHRHTNTAFNSAAAAHVPSEQVSKAVILGNSKNEYLMAIVPANRRLLLESVNKMMGEHFHLIAEAELKDIFQDCEVGAIPSAAAAYQMNALVDDTLFKNEQVYIEAGDHEHLVKVNSTQFSSMMMNAPHGHISGGNVGDSWARENPPID
ncbi:aminoacyl-tRNA deacylase [Algicola sagamiensis]|uniref:aminoacyl-tRNA deacylase n=1 Tax=Algicola sagamiensis TaxID=163869 RepID=UPI0003A6C795|nr:YbaK/EbsC family protein [Algicola sagamiensis]